LFFYKKSAGQLRGSWIQLRRVRSISVPN